MADCSSSAINKVLASQETEDSYEESGWTAYLEDLSNYREDSSCSSFHSPSLVSDAASGAPWKLSGNKDHIFGSPPSQNIPRKLTLNKKTRKEEITHDDSLEDTASSPINSPKLGDLRSMDINSKKIEEHIYSSLGKVTSSEEKDEVKFEGKKEYLDLKQRGLCLVPLSTIVNYYG